MPDKEMPWGFKGYCEDCGVWEHDKDLKVQRLGIVVASKTRYGLCKRRAPRSERPGAKGFFPVMGGNEWCFEFMKKAVKIFSDPDQKPLP